MPPVASASRLQTRRRSPDGVGRYNHFSGSGGSSIYWTPTSGAHSVHGAIRTKWTALGGRQDRWAIRSPMRSARRTGWGGTTTSRVREGPRSTGRQMTGAHWIAGAIRAKWAALGWETGLGYPTTDERRRRDGVGRYNHFSGAGGNSIFWSPKTGAHYVAGAIRAKWAALGWEQGPLGYPTTDEMGSPDGVGRYNHFSGDGGHSIYWSPKTGAHWVTGAIRARWASLGWEREPAGLPDQRRVLGFRRPGIGLSARPPDLEFDHQAGYRIAVPASVPEPQTLLAPGPHRSGPDGPDLCET